MEQRLLLLASTFCCIGACPAQTVMDIDGNIYPTVTIGAQLWMAENLKVTHYQNGDPIPNVSASLVWDNLTTGGRCYYENDSAAYAATYGALYNWYAMVDPRNVCPVGWHVSTDHEWNVLAYYLDPTVDTLTIDFTGTDVGGQLKEAGTSHWIAPNEGATNSSGFSALPGGQRYGGSNFHDLNERGLWWTATQAFAQNHGWYRHLLYVAAGIQRLSYFKLNGMACRCVGDFSTTTSHAPTDAPGLRLFPNPATDQVRISGLPMEGATARLYAPTGQLVAQRKLAPGDALLDLRTLAPGIYLLRITTGREEFQERLLVR